MAIKSISDLFNYSLFIFDLDNTLYNEEDYLFQAYMAIGDKFAGFLPDKDKDELYNILVDTYYKSGRDKLFDNFLERVGLARSYVADCLNILRTFKPGKPLMLFEELKELLRALEYQDKSIFILTNGNVEQQKNKIRYINWDGLAERIRVVYAEDIEPKPSSAGVHYILKITGADISRTIFIGDKETDRVCAENGGVSYIDVKTLTELS
jgi:HAD superfamily hydrolase (TIGR01549 family)